MLKATLQSSQYIHIHTVWLKKNYMVEGRTKTVLKTNITKRYNMLTIAYKIQQCDIGSYGNYINKIFRIEATCAMY